MAWEQELVSTIARSDGQELVPRWFIEHMPADRPPWLRAGWGPDDRYRCPHSCLLL